MATLAVRRLATLGPRSAGIRMTPREFDRADFEEGWRYELINGVLVVSPTPLAKERDSNEELGHLLRNYQEEHPQGGNLDVTLPEHTIRTKGNRRRCDRALWIGLGRLPRAGDAPTIIVEFVSSGKRDHIRDYQEKRGEYLGIGVKEYWVIDRFARTLTVFRREGRQSRKQLIREDRVYATDLLPGFELRLERLLTLADRWPEEEDQTEA